MPSRLTPLPAPLFSWQEYLSLMSARKIRRAAAHATRKAERKAGFPAVPATRESAVQPESNVIPLTRYNGFFTVLPTEDQDGFEALKQSLAAEHRPTTATEVIFINTMLESHWLALRAQRLAKTCVDSDTGIVTDEKSFGLYFRCETTYRRAFHKASSDLAKLRSERRKAGSGFEAQKCEDKPVTQDTPPQPEPRELPAVEPLGFEAQKSEDEPIAKDAPPQPEKEPVPTAA